MSNDAGASGPIDSSIPPYVPADADGDVRSVLRKLIELGKRLPASLAALIAMRAVEEIGRAHV